MFSPGDIVQIYSPTAGKHKYHLCICAYNENNVAQFLFINSKQGFKGDFVIAGDIIDCIPKSPTGKSIISCNVVVRFTADQIKLFQAKTLGRLPEDVGIALIDYVKSTPALSGNDKRAVIAGLTSAFIKTSN